MDLESVLAALDQPLPRDQVKQLKGVDYVSGHYVIETANQLFGANGWSHELTLQKVEHIGQHKGNEVVVVRSIVRVHAIGTHHDGSGVAIGEMKSIAGAMELAFKASETDAMKRALKNFGKPLGLALYEKVENGAEREGVGASTFAQDLIGELQALECNGESLRNWMDSRNSDIGSLHEEDARMVNQAYEAKRAAALEQYYEQGIAAAEDLASVNTKFVSAQKAGLDQLAIRRLHQKAESRKEWLQMQRSRAGNQ